MASFEMSPELSEQVRVYAKSAGCTNDEAAERLVTVAINRINALRRYSKSHTPGKKAPKAKPAKKAAKAKGPLARKVKKAPKSAEVPTQVQ